MAMRIRDLLDYVKQHIFAARDFLCVVAASMFSNAALQFFLYPAIENRTGETRYGEILVFITIANVCGLAFGGAADVAHLTSRREYKAKAADFIQFLAIVSALTSVVALICVRSYLAGPGEALCLVLLIVLTVYQCYSFVDFQISGCYHRYLLFTVITGGIQVACLPLFWLTGQWPVLLLPGMAAGILYVHLQGQLYRDPIRHSENFGRSVRDSAVISGAYLLNYGTQQADRFLLLPLMGGTAVTLFYVACLFSKTLSMVVGPINNLTLGYLSNKKHPLTRWTFVGINVLILVGGTLIGAVVIVLSPLLLGLPFLYPDLVEAVRPYIPLASAAQLLIIGSSITVNIDLLVAPGKMQVLLQGAYMVLCIVLAIPFTLRGGLNGFAAASCMAAAARYLISVIIGLVYIRPEN